LQDEDSSAPRSDARSRRDNFFLKIGIVGIMIRGAQSGRVGGAAAFSRSKTSFAPRSSPNGLKRQEAAKRAA